MKITTLIIFTLFFVSLSFSQGLQFEKGINDDYKQEILQVANKNEFSFLLIKYDFNHVYLEKYDSIGNRLEKQIIQPGQGFEVFVPQRMIVTNDGNVWISGFGADACDVVFFREHLLVYDSNCQFINAFSKITGSVQNTQNYAALSPISDTSVAVNYRNDDSSWVEILSPNLQTILPNMNTPDLFGFGKNTQSYVLGHTINKIYSIDNQGILLDSITLPGTFREIGTWNDTIIVLGYNQLYKVTPDLQSYTTHTIPNLSNFTRLKIDNQGVRFISGNFNLAVHYLNHNLDIQSLTTVPVFSPNNTLYDFDKTVTVAKDYVLTEFESVRLANYSLTSSQSNLINRTDVAVLAVQIVDSYAQLISSNTVYKTDAKTNVLIKNVGQNTVDSVRLNHLVSFPIICGYDVTASYFSNLSLAPGDSVWIDFGWMGEHIANYTAGDSLTRDYCIYSSNPNGIVDLNVGNDVSCETQFFGTVGLDEQVKIDFSIYPNPSNDVINIKTPIDFDGKVRVLDQLGRTVIHQSLTGPISLSAIKKGIYFISLEDRNDNSTTAKKLVRN